MTAFVVAAISIVYVYGTLKDSIHMTSYSKERTLLVDRGYEWILMQLHYPRVRVQDTEQYNGQNISFTSDVSPVEIPGVSSVILKVESEKALISYEFFKMQR